MNFDGKAEGECVGDSKYRDAWVKNVKQKN